MTSKRLLLLFVSIGIIGLQSCYKRVCVLQPYCDSTEFNSTPTKEKSITVTKHSIASNSKYSPN